MVHLRHPQSSSNNSIPQARSKHNNRMPRHTIIKLLIITQHIIIKRNSNMHARSSVHHHMIHRIYTHSIMHNKPDKTPRRPRSYIQTMLP